MQRTKKPWASKKSSAAWLLFGWLVFLTVLSLVPVKIPDQKLPSNSDKWVHVFFYFVLTILVYFNLIQRLKKKPQHILIIFAIGLSVVYGIIIEVLQVALTNYRSADFLDILANISGSLLASVAILLSTKYKLS
ncbi:MAG: VanZ family protein [Flavobacteriaceae bacterium]|nr:VanZ family protein [Flavobacteriaceae bacterium]